ncbi:type II secretion system protein GspF [Geothermobacter hydrogeniphilus]|uniref:General secretion pathway protein F n=1 Tax=Geothermobacter hydrogeniphilus TaxID=1969733 RepID=A0A2K2H946_9BACT|nr:type II secretion system inner membrane protein GspF [Geothermobacter hydrogeniphilus]PNU19838.1 type II secretion system protein GspF [Geothermobacter hydrogeniphilus]
MPTYEYSGFDARGKKVSGTHEGSGRRAVMAALRQQGIFPTEIHPEGSRRKPIWQRSFQLRSGVPIEDLAIATRQLATLLGAGLALDEALGSVAGQLEKVQLATAFNRARDQVVQGETLHQALAMQERLFPPIFINMVQVGENSGTLDQVLERLADFLEEQARLRGKISAALAYPVLMALVGCGVLFFLVSYVLPKVTRMLTDLDQVLPLPTRLLIAVSGLLQSYGWLVLLLLAAAALLLRRWARSEQGGTRIDRLALRLPLVGRLNLLIATARFSRTLGTLLQSGVPLLRALDIASNLLSNRVLRQAVTIATAQVREGEGLAVPLQRLKVFPTMLVQMIAVGERSGEMEQMLFRVADTYEHQVDLAIGRLLSLLEPIMILLMGGAVGFIVLAILLPIFQASQGLG